MTEKRNKNPGPNPEILRAEGVEWEDAVAHALRKKKPDEWPEKDKGGKSDKKKGQRDE